MTTISHICTKRLTGDIKLLQKEPLEFIDAIPDEEDILKWYFIVKGPSYSDFKDGYYLGIINHNPEYPFKPPDFKMLTPNGRFSIDKKICLSNSNYHSNEWNTMWNIKTILVGFLSIMLDDDEYDVSHIRSSKKEKEMFAKNSIEYNKKYYLNIIKKFTRFFDENGNPKSDNQLTSNKQQNQGKQLKQQKQEQEQHKQQNKIEIIDTIKNNNQKGKNLQEPINSSILEEITKKNKKNGKKNKEKKLIDMYNFEKYKDNIEFKKTDYIYQKLIESIKNIKLKTLNNNNFLSK